MILGTKDQMTVIHGKSYQTQIKLVETFLLEAAS